MQFMNHQGGFIINGFRIILAVLLLLAILQGDWHFRVYATVASNPG
jgi:hypothetical protein